MIDYSKVLSDVVKEMKPSGIRKFFDIANTMEDVISLGVGEPDFRTPRQIRSAGIRSLERGSTRYTANRGLMELCTEISRYVSRKYGVEYTPKDEVLVKNIAMGYVGSDKMRLTARYNDLSLAVFGKYAVDHTVDH